MNQVLTIIGTDTEVGKTFVTSALAAIFNESGIDCGVSKPVQSGATSVSDPASDAYQLKLFSGTEDPLALICPYSFPDPLAPPIAAARSNESISLQDLLNAAHAVIDRHPLTLVETAGGLLSPTASDGTVADFAKALGAPAIIVARAGLGTVNHTLLTVEVAQKRGLSVIGIILNQASGELSEADNPTLIAQYTNVPILGIVPGTPKDSTPAQAIQAVRTALADNVRKIIADAATVQSPPFSQLR